MYKRQVYGTLMMMMHGHMVNLVLLRAVLNNVKVLVIVMPLNMMALQTQATVLFGLMEHAI